MATVEHIGTNQEYDIPAPLPSNISEITETERGLVPNTRYVMRVRALNGLGVTSDWSESIEFDVGSDLTTPATPANVKLSTVDGHITVLWDEVTTNEDGSAISDLAFYEVLLQDNVHYGILPLPPSGLLPSGYLPPFRYTAITNSYTFLYSANKAIHDALHPQKPPSDNWSVIVRAVDFSGNSSGDGTDGTNDPIDLSFGGSGENFPINFQSSDYDGTSVEDGDATDGIRIQENGEAEFNDLRINGDLKVKGHSITKPPISIFTKNEANTAPGRQTFGDTNYNAVSFNDEPLVGLVNSSSIVGYSSGIHTIQLDGWYRLTLSHRWVVNGVGARHSHVEINGGAPKALGGHPAGGALTTELNNYTDIRCFSLSAGDELVFRLMQDSGGDLDLIYAQLIIEWLSE